MSAMYLVGFCRRTNPLARLIMWFTGSRISHTYLVQIGSTPTHRYVLDASGFHGTEISWYNRWLDRGFMEVSEYVFTDYTLPLDSAWTITADRFIGRRYGWLQLIGDAYVIAVRRLTGARVGNPFGNPSGLVCSELVLEWLRAAGVGGFSHLDPATVTAENIRLVVVGHQSFEEAS